MVIRYVDGSYVEGAIRQLDGDTVRIAIAGIDHTVEYQFIQGRWTSRTGVQVTFEFPREQAIDLIRRLPPAKRGEEGQCAAGGDCALRRLSGLDAGPVN